MTQFQFAPNFILQAITLYWCTSNIISLGQAKILRMQYLRDKLEIGQIVKKPKPKTEKKKEGFIKGIKNCEGHYRH